jgi:hypothetical protein
MDHLPQRFTAAIEKSGAKYRIFLPFDPNTVWEAKARHHITGTIQQHKVRGPLAAEGHRYYLALGAAWRRDNGLDAGDRVEVVLAPEGPQAGTLAADIAGALAAQPEAKAFFDSLATFYRSNYIRWVEGARRPETRATRIQELLALLQAGKKQR